MTNCLQLLFNGWACIETATTCAVDADFTALADFASYSEAQQRAERLYKDQKKWNAMSLVNTAKAGIFAADRAIRDYANNIWLAEPVKTASTANTKKKA